MARLKKYNNHNEENLFSQKIDQIMKVPVYTYIIIMLGVFPLYYQNQYERIGSLKFQLFWDASLIFLAVILLIYVTGKLIQMSFHYRTVNKRYGYYNKKKSQYFVRWKDRVKKILNALSFLDKAILGYGLCVVISFLVSDFKDFALKGASGWEMGLYSQLIFIGLYMVFSRQKELPKSILAIHLTASGAVFLLGILHRFEIDPLGMYVGLSIAQKTEFLSTLGQATWFSSYMCTTFCVGMVCFYLSLCDNRYRRGNLETGRTHKNRKPEKNFYSELRKTLITWLMGIYTILSFGILVTQNSDSAFMALAGILLLLGYYSLQDIYKWVSFWQIMIMMWGAFGGIGILQKVFADRAILLDSLSIFFSQSTVTWILFAISLGAYLIFDKLADKNGKKLMCAVKKGYRICLGVLAAGVVLGIVFIYLNTKGYLLEWFGYQSQNSYLLFDYHWGNNRGSSWMIAWQEFWNLPLKNKLFGVGPDCFSEYLYSIPEIQELLHNLWGNLRLTNAHNEYLNSLICYGIAGLTAWLAVLIGGIRYFYIKAKENPFMIAFALCIVGYVCHNLFCYQQVCCTPFLFILLGIGECLTKSAKSHTIK